jgi:host factor-I protein
MSYRSPLTARKLKNPPPGETGYEAGYLKHLGEKQTQVSVKLVSGEIFRGWIEYYDQYMIRLTRDNAPNLFIYKHEVLYISEEGRSR